MAEKTAKKKNKKGFKLSSLKTNEDHEINGKWMDYEGGMQVKVARWNNRRFMDLLNRLVRPHRSRGGKKMDQELGEQLEMQAMSKTILMDWRNCLDDDGNEIPYTPERGLEAFREFRDFYAHIRDMSLIEDEYRVESLEEDEGNS